MDGPKKVLTAAERDPAERARFRAAVASVDPRRLVFVDEAGTHVALTRRHARAPRGERAFGVVPRHRGRVTTLLASLTPAGTGPALVVEAGTTTAVFGAYVERVLAPSLVPGQVVVLDDLAAHHGERVRKLVEDRGCELLFLPAYSPDFSPVEEANSLVKALLRRAAVRRRGDELVEAIGRALGAVTARDAAGWFGHCGYPLATQPS